jgi:flagellar motor protein MotB
LDKIYDLLDRNYPDSRVVIRGHTGGGDDEDANVKLSEARARAVQKYLTDKGMSPNRFKTEGKGSSDHDRWYAEQRKRPDFNPRQAMQREPRVEFDLFMDSGF